MRGAYGTIHRRVSVEAGFHDFDKEFVVVVRATHHVVGTTTHRVIPLSISAAVRLRQELDDVLNDAMWDGVDPQELHN